MARPAGLVSSAANPLAAAEAPARCQSEYVVASSNAMPEGTHERGAVGLNESRSSASAQVNLSFQHETHRLHAVLCERLLSSVPRP